MASRPLTDKFRTRQNELSQFHGDQSDLSETSKTPLLKQPLSKGIPIIIPVTLTGIIDDINGDIFNIETAMEELNKLHIGHLMPGSFDDVDKNSEHIDIVTNNITKMFQQTKKKIININSLPNNASQEKNIKNNTQMALATKLQELSKKFKKMQNDYLSRITSQRNKFKGTNIWGEDETNAMDIEMGFGQRTIQMATFNHEIIEERDKEIEKIAKSVTEIVEIFNDLNTLVMDQGTMIDNIEENIISAEEHVENATNNLKDAKKYAATSGKLMWIILIIILVVIVSGVIIMKVMLKI